MGVMHLCRFYTSLIKLGLVDLADDADTVAMAHFTPPKCRQVSTSEDRQMAASSRETCSQVATT
ncbi:hypothetical protein FB451DRAFT_1413069 [Mycena latifolia]|nr:hypothetical protein FB451DRAFT_1413069 [Mycena latifolia]